LIIAGFIVTLVGIALLLGLYKVRGTVPAFVPGLLTMGLGLGLMLTPSVNVVQSSFSEAQQGEISGLSRSVSNLGSSLGTAIAGTIVVADASAGNESYVAAMLVLSGFALIGLAASLLIPAQPRPQRE
jgi:predicted MFS family arabinose efflux permease